MARKKTFDSFLTYVAGTYYYRTAAARCQRRQKLTLIRNPDNPHDANAIQIWAEGAQIGHVPRDVAARLARAIDRGQRVDAHIVRVDFWNEEGYPERVEVRVRVHNLT